MNTAQLRLNLQKYHSQTETFRLETYFGKKPTRSLEEIEEVFSDLLSGSTVESLKKIIENSADQTATEQKALKNLLHLAQLGFIRAQTLEISAEIKKSLDSVRFNFQNETFKPNDARPRIKTESDPGLRREIFDRLVDSEYICADLWDEKILHIRENIWKTASENPFEFFEKLAGVGFQDLAKKGKDFLTDTEETYFQLLAEVSALADLETKNLTFADLYFLQEKTERKVFFPGNQLSIFYAQLLENFGFSPGRIPQIVLKRTPARRPTAVFTTSVPDAVFLLISKRDGTENYLEFFQKFGHAQKDAWTSRKLTERYPEFVFAPEVVLGNGYGFLFRSLLTDESFLRKSFFVRDERSEQRIIRENNFRILLEARREILRFLTELEVFSNERPDFEEIRRTWAENFTNHLGFQFKKEQIIFEIFGDFSAQKNLRSIIFGYSLREYLRERHDFQWWKSRSCFEELIDFWNTAERYRAEEMAGLIGFEMSFDLLAESFTSAK